MNSQTPSYNKAHSRSDHLLNAFENSLKYLFASLIKRTLLNPNTAVAARPIKSTLMRFELNKTAIAQQIIFHNSPRGLTFVVPDTTAKNPSCFITHQFISDGKSELNYYLLDKPLSRTQSLILKLLNKISSTKSKTILERKFSSLHPIRKAANKLKLANKPGSIISNEPHWVSMTITAPIN